MRRLLSVAALTLAWGCAELLGLDEYGSGQESDAPAATTSVGPGGGGAGGGPTTMPAEVCTDGVDNDGDGAIDCEDDACDNHECLPPPPAGWLGPVALAIGDPNMLPTCPGGRAEFEGGNGPATMPPAACPCSCDAPTLSCQGNFYFGNDASCELLLNPMYGSNCENAVGTQFVLATAFATSSPACGVTSTDPPLESVTWPTMARGCAAKAGGGCGELVCVAMPAGFDRRCVYRVGLENCPTTEYTEPFVVERYNMLNDDRGCDVPCTCDAPSAGCGGNFAVYPQNACIGTPAIIPINICTDATFPVASMEYTPMATGTCDPKMRSPIGDATPFDTTTVCCKPR